MEISEHVLAEWYALLSASVQVGAVANVNDVTKLYSLACNDDTFPRLRQTRYAPIGSSLGSKFGNLVGKEVPRLH